MKTKKERGVNEEVLMNRYIREGREEMDRLCRKFPRYRGIVETIRRHLSLTSDRSTVEYHATLDPKHPSVRNDEAYVDQAAASLGMGTKMMPSKRYGRHGAHT